MFELLKPKKNMSDSERLRRKIFLYSLGEVILILLLFGFSFFLFRIMVG